MRNVKLTIAYDGADFRGWQIQPDQRTVQQTLIDAITAVVGHGVRVTGSGRTDTGVHARGQAANFHTTSLLPCERLLHAINSHLPTDIVVRRVEDALEGFDANRDAQGKWYRYTILNTPLPDIFQVKYAHHVRYPLDADRMDRAARALVGEHDFRCFESEWPNRATSVRTITRSQVARMGELIWYDVAAHGFLYNMVRAIVGSLLLVGMGKQPVEWLARLVRTGLRKDAGPTAPACGLCLMNVTY
jgi:tRNA pseudouridine38-40 synthase